MASLVLSNFLKPGTLVGFLRILELPQSGLPQIIAIESCGFHELGVLNIRAVTALANFLWLFLMKLLTFAVQNLI